MGVEPIMRRQPDFPTELLGAAMNAFYGGRADCRIRRFAVPVVYLDFLSMYPTVNSLFRNWDLLIAERIEVVDATSEVQALLKGTSLADCLSSETWPRLRGLAWLQPDRGVLPVRADYTEEGTGYAIGINPVAADRVLCYTLPDLLASKLLSGRVPRIYRAVRFEPVGQLRSLRPVLLIGAIRVDPRRDDFFRALIEERKRVAGRSELDAAEKDRLAGFLKVLANSSSYGIFAETVRQELPAGQKKSVEVFGLDEPFSCSVGAPERPGEYCFPPLAATITGGARLMLAILECCVGELGGSYAMCDTDSMAIVATEAGDVLTCPSGQHRMGGGSEGIRALSWPEVERIRERFVALNPYDRSAIPGSILELEGDNFDAESGQCQLYSYAISAKRYALYNLKTEGGEVVLRKYSEHGLGHLLNPSDPLAEGVEAVDAGSADDNADDGVGQCWRGPRRWIHEAWKYIVTRDALDRQASLPSWAGRPAVSRITASSPVVLRPFRHLNQSRPYSEQVKPFNFLLTVQVAPFGLPDGVEADRFQLVAPFELDARRWRKMPWYTLYPCGRGPLDHSGDQERTRLPAGTRFRIDTTGGLELAREDSARVKTYRDVIAEYRRHPEAKSLASDGQPCSRSTRGLLRRRPVTVRTGQIRYIGKESNRLEDIQSGLVHNLGEVLIEYPDPALDFWVHLLLPTLKEIGPAELHRRTGVPLSTIKHALAGRRPSASNRRKLAAAAAQETGGPGGANT